MSLMNEPEEDSYRKNGKERLCAALLLKEKSRRIYAEHRASYFRKLCIAESSIVAGFAAAELASMMGAAWIEVLGNIAVFVGSGITLGFIAKDLALMTGVSRIVSGLSVSRQEQGDDDQ